MWDSSAVQFRIESTVAAKATVFKIQGLKIILPELI